MLTPNLSAAETKRHYNFMTENTRLNNSMLPEPLLRAYTHKFEIHFHNTIQFRDLHKFPFRTTLFGKSFLKVFLRQHITMGLF